MELVRFGTIAPFMAELQRILPSKEYGDVEGDVDLFLGQADHCNVAGSYFVYAGIISTIGPHMQRLHGENEADFMEGRGPLTIGDFTKGQNQDRPLAKQHNILGSFLEELTQEFELRQSVSCKCAVRPATARNWDL